MTLYIIAALMFFPGPILIEPIADLLRLQQPDGWIVVVWYATAITLLILSHNLH